MLSLRNELRDFGVLHICYYLICYQTNRIDQSYHEPSKPHSIIEQDLQSMIENIREILSPIQSLKCYLESSAHMGLSYLSTYLREQTAL